MPMTLCAQLARPSAADSCSRHGRGPTHAAASSKKHTVASHMPHMYLLIPGRAHAAAACIVLSLDVMRHVCPGWWFRGRPFPVRAHCVVSTLADPMWLVQVVDLNVAGVQVPLLWQMYVWLQTGFADFTCRLHYMSRLHPPLTRQWASAYWVTVLNEAFPCNK